MKKTFAILAFATALMGNVAQAEETYTEYVKQCITENIGAGYDAQMTAAYCVCMDNLIPDGETLTVTQWAKSHPDEEKVCTRKAGWK